VRHDQLIGSLALKEFITDRRIEMYLKRVEINFVSWPVLMGLSLMLAAEEFNRGPAYSMAFGLSSPIAMAQAPTESVVDTARANGNFNKMFVAVQAAD
jgi:hypothetical protein